jgi:hypothetical protein
MTNMDSMMPTVASYSLTTQEVKIKRVRIEEKDHREKDLRDLRDLKVKDPKEVRDSKVRADLITVDPPDTNPEEEETITEGIENMFPEKTEKEAHTEKDPEKAGIEMVPEKVGIEKVGIEKALEKVVDIERERASTEMVLEMEEEAVEAPEEEEEEAEATEVIIEIFNYIIYLLEEALSSFIH